MKAKILFLVALLAWSCSDLTYNSSVNPNVDLSSYTSFNCGSCSNNIDPKIPYLQNEQVKQIVRESIGSELISRGLVENQEEPDLVVEFKVIIEDRIDTAVQRTTDYRYWFGFETDAYNYQEGSIFINLVDRDEGFMVWQGRAVRVLEKEPSNPEKRIQKVISKIFEDFPDIRGND